MTMRRAIVNLLDRPGGRALLAMTATHLARRALGNDVEILYDGHLWIHRVGQLYYPTDRRFDYYTASFQEWRTLPATYLANAQDFWFRHGRPRPGETVLDIGAGRGEDTLAFSRAVGDTGRVIAIEAHPLSFQLLAAFCRFNRLTNVTPLNLAVMDGPGEVSMVESADWRAHAIKLGGSPTTIRVPAETLDGICDTQGIHHIDFLKMNIEGAERYALAGAETTITRTTSLCIACHDFLADRGQGEHYRTREFVERFLADHSFRTQSHPEDARDFIRYHVFASATMA